MKKSSKNVDVHIHKPKSIFFLFLVSDGQVFAHIVLVPN